MADVLGRTPLSVKLVVAVLGLVTSAVTVVGAATVTALREELTGRIDRQLADLGDQARKQIAAGHTELQFPVPEDQDTSLKFPNPFLIESLDTDRRLVSSLPRQLPPDPPDLKHADLSRTEPFTVHGLNGTMRWRVLSVTAPGGQHIVIGAQLSDVDGTVGRLVWFVLLVGLSIVATVAVLAVWLVKASLRPLAQIEQTTAVIAAGDLSRRAPELDPRTEVGRLGRAFNLMIEQIEDAFAARSASEATARSSEEKMRRFVADASHELRTPLTIIRGFAELYRHGAVQDPREAAGLVGRIEDQARRMAVLVEDLLLLARLDQQRPLAVEPVDLVALASDVLEGFHAVERDRPLALDVATPAPLIVTGDEQRLRQVISNLVANALTHTGVDAEVTVRLSRRPGQAVVEVTDTGPGLGPDEAQRVFERFYRADPARTRTSEKTGTGLGLAIVAAIVTAHAGTAEVESDPGRATTFRVLLPAAEQQSGQ
ncbi:ATP-binding protein [Dactylosporangium sp. NPDC005572]|uniref:sensor histidine kinase n=1 Tax=Dactylosporangium sp. NPDC005572 TaxID=3156889 RepID=UPI0033BD9EFB